MAEPDFTALDSRLRDALGQAAQQGDSTGVADAIRARVAAGDPGVSAPGPVAPGWRRAPGWVFGGVLIAVLVLGGSASVAGLALAPTAAPQAASSATASPLPEPSETPTPTSAPTSTPSPAPPVVIEEEPVPAPPPPPADVTAPTVQVGSSQPTVYTGNGAHTILTAVAADAVGVVRVDLAWSGHETGAATMTFAGGVWTYDYDRPGGAPPTTGHLTFVATAFDAAGNAGSATVVVAVAY